MFLCPWDFPGKSTGVSCHFLRPGIFQTQGLNMRLLHLLHWQANSLPLPPPHRFKGLDLIDRVPEKLWTEVHDTVQDAVIKTIPKHKKGKKAKWLPEEALQIAEKEKMQKAKEKRKDIPI